MFRKPWAAPLALAALALAVYWRSFWVPILDSDDYIYYFRDARLAGPSLENLWRILTRPYFANFHPVTTLTYAFDRAIWGAWTPGYHVTQLAFYAAGVIGIYFLFAQVLGRRAGPFLGAAIYAVHTIHVESVAWLASRKDVVCLLFYVLALLAYIRYARDPKAGRGTYVLSLAFAAAAMLSKGYAVVLPAVLLAYDACIAGRLTRRQLLDKVPFLVLSAAAIFLTFHAQDRDSALIQSTIGWDRRAALLAESLALYVGRSLVPIDLTAFYLVGGEATVGPAALAGGCLAVLLVGGFFYLRRRLPAAAFGIALFLLPLATVMNVFFTLRFWITDRYLFFPTIGSTLALVAVAEWARMRWGSGRARGRAVRRGLVAAGILVVAAYAGMTVARIGVWTSPLSFWSDVARKQLRLGGSGPVRAEDLAAAPRLQSIPGGTIIGLARAYSVAGDTAESERLVALVRGGARGADEERELELAVRALEVDRLDEARRRLGPIAAGNGWLAPVAVLYMSVVEERDGNMLAAAEARRRGIERYHAAGQTATDGLLEVGDVEFGRGSFTKAAGWYRLASEESPNEAKAAYFLGRALAEGGRLEEAMRQFGRIADGSLAILPWTPFTIDDVNWNLGLVAQRLGRAEEALGHYRAILRRSPNHPQRAMIEAQITSIRGSAAR